MPTHLFPVDLPLPIARADAVLPTAAPGEPHTLRTMRWLSSLSLLHPPVTSFGAPRNGCWRATQLILPKWQNAMAYP